MGSWGRPTPPGTHAADEAGLGACVVAARTPLGASEVAGALRELSHPAVNEPEPGIAAAPAKVAVGGGGALLHLADSPRSCSGVVPDGMNLVLTVATKAGEACVGKPLASVVSTGVPLRRGVTAVATVLRCGTLLIVARPCGPVGIGTDATWPGFRESGGGLRLTFLFVTPPASGASVCCCTGGLLPLEDLPAFAEICKSFNTFCTVSVLADVAVTVGAIASAVVLAVAPLGDSPGRGGLRMFIRDGPLSRAVLSCRLPPIM